RADVHRAGVAVDENVGVVVDARLVARHADVLLAVAGGLAGDRRAVRGVADPAYPRRAAGPVVALGVRAAAVGRLEALHAGRVVAAAVAAVAAVLVAGRAARLGRIRRDAARAQVLRAGVVVDRLVGVVGDGLALALAVALDLL